MCGAKGTTWGQGAYVRVRRLRGGKGTTWG